MISLQNLDALLKRNSASRDSFNSGNLGFNPLADAQGQANAQQTQSPWDTPIPYATTSTTDAPSKVGGFGSFAGGWDGLVNNPLGRAVGLNGLLDLLGHGFQKVEDATGISNVNGFIRGALTAPHEAQSPVRTDNGYLNYLKDIGHNSLGSLEEILHGGVAGFKDPHSADAKFAEANQALMANANPVTRHTWNFLAGAGTDPIMSFAPLGKILGGATKLGAEGIGRIPQINKVISDLTKSKAGKYYDSSVPKPVRPEPAPAPFDDGMGVHEGYVPKEAPPAPPARMTAEQQLEQVMSMLKPEINKMKTDPLNMRRGQKVDFLAKEMGATPEEILQSWSSKKHIDSAVADIVGNKPHSAYEQMAADKLGFNLDDILNGKIDPRFEPKTVPNPETRFTMGSIVPYAGEHLPLGQTAAEAAHTAGRSKFIDDIMNGTSAGSRLRNAATDSMGDFMKPISDRLSKMGIGSGLNSMPESVRNYVLNNRAELESGVGKLDAFSQSLAKKISDMGITKSQLSEMRNAHELGQEITDPKLKSIRDMIVKATNEGINGVEAGLAHETKHGLAPKDLRENYMHLSTETPSWFKGMMKKEKGTITQGYTKDRHYATAAEAEADGHVVRDPISSMLDRLVESNKDISNYKLYKGILDMADNEAGIVSSTAQAGMKRFVSEVKNNPLNGKYVNESVRRFLKELERVPVAQQKGILPSILKGYDKTMGAYRNVTLYNPMVHNHNTFGNFFVSAGATPAMFKEARNLLTGEGKVSSEMQTSMHWAEKTGALGNDSHYNRFKSIDRLLDGKREKGVMKSFQDKSLWEPEKQQRLALFHKERMENLDKGMNAETAANKARDAVNKHLGDYTTNNLSKFEREVMQRLDPYYKWHKSNYPLQIKNLFNPDVIQRRAFADRGLNELNNSTAGHDQQDNIGAEKEKRKIHAALGDGKYASIDPYVPWQESNKMLEEGSGNFLWNRLSPPLRTGLLQLLNEKYYPNQATAPQDAKSMANMPIVGNLDTTGQALDKRFTAIADSLAPSMIKNLTELMGSPVGRAENPNNPNINPLLRMLIGSTGAFINPAPTSQEKVDQNTRMSTKAKQDELRKYMIEQMKKQGRE